jgi:DNA-binding MarR family transcriptional regulator
MSANLKENSASRETAGIPVDPRRMSFLRYTHIFASAVREILEAKFLDEVSPYSLTLPQFHLLKLITLHGGHQVGEVAVFLGMSPPAATKNIDKLQRLGLILRKRCKGDRRATLISPSAKGRRLVEDYENLKTDRMNPVLANFSPQELNQMVRLLRRFSLSLIRTENPGDGMCLLCAAYCQEDCPIGLTRGGCPCLGLRGAA